MPKQLSAAIAQVKFTCYLLDSLIEVYFFIGMCYGDLVKAPASHGIIVSKRTLTRYLGCMRFTVVNTLTSAKSLNNVFNNTQNIY